ncbi:cytochrome P450 [Streptomyces calidiresistens]|uniref:Cytochrome P450 n=1 Tax=Streptomyces calidiresistens TaxID=1485586 RepID=A0A7W3SZJ1_9ACTN|nr:cytochrome P450 [Streptomyces calidiresistens]MBB0228194.1 cytochrome P450 [Streptomyces calidiresistens]
MLRYPFERENCLSPMPHPELPGRSRPTRVVMPSGHPAHLVTRYRDVARALADHRLSRRGMLVAPGGPRFTPADIDEPGLLGLDPPDHTRVRRLCAPAFRPGPVGARAPGIRALAHRLLDGLRAWADPVVDLHHGFSLPLATATTADLLGIPSDDHPALVRWARQKLSLTGLPPERARAGHLALRSHFEALALGSPTRRPRAGMIALLAGAHAEGRIGRTELPAVLVNLFVAGHTTTSAVLTNGLLRLLVRPARWSALIDEPALIGPAVAEILRHDVAGDMSLPRLATEDLRIGETTVRAGEAVIPAHAYANRDPEVFDRPDEFDITRRPARNLAFGHGPHHCIGSALAVLELEIALTAVTERFPRLRLAAPPGTLPWNNGSLTGGVTSLPVHL